MIENVNGDYWVTKIRGLDLISISSNKLGMQNMYCESG